MKGNKNMFNFFKKKTLNTKPVTSSDYLVCNVLIRSVPLEARTKRFIYYKKGNDAYSNEFAYASDTYVQRDAECIANVNWRFYLWGLDKA